MGNLEEKVALFLRRRKIQKQNQLNSESRPLTEAERREWAWAMAFLYAYHGFEMYPKYKTCYKLSIDDFYKETFVEPTCRARFMMKRHIEEAHRLLEKQLNETKVKVWFQEK